jgi:hypothetical protein
MITPSYGLTATERVLPRMALDFTSALLDSRVTFTRSGNTATVTNSSGVIVAINADLPRFDFDPTTLVCKGLLIENARTNALLNSLIDGTSLTTQLVTVTAAARTFSFYGTGTVVLSGAHSATVVGTGAYPTRTTLTFTPSAGVLTLTVSGTVQFAQLEIGSVSTSFIPTAATAVTRNADVATMTGTNFSSWYNQTEGTMVVEAQCQLPLTANKTHLFDINAGGAVPLSMSILANAATTLRATTFEGSTQAGLTLLTVTANVFRIAYAIKANSFAGSGNGANILTDNSGTVPSAMTQMDIGFTSRDTPTQLNGHIRKMFYYPQRLINAEVQSFAK